MAKNTQKQTDNNDSVENHEVPVSETQEATTDIAPEQEHTPDVQQEVEQLRGELDTANDKYLRLYAEFDNYKRRVSKERIELMQSAGKEVIANLLPVIDDLDRALKAFETVTDIVQAQEGISLVTQKLKTILGNQGLKEMESIGHPFDADLQEAITNVPAPSDDLKGKVIDEIEKGYFLHDKVLRHAKVVVGS